jgi:hypothetical protein
MTKPTMTSQWDPGNYRPLDMSKIPGYPRRMPLTYKNHLPSFFGLDGESPDYHMRNFWEFFQHFPVRDEAEDIVMKLFSASLHEGAKNGMIIFRLAASHPWTILKRSSLKGGL